MSLHDSEGQVIRPVEPGDQAYIAKTWTKSVCSTHRVPGASSKGHVHQRHIGSRMWNAASERIDAVMDRRETLGLVVADPLQPAYIRGWIVYADCGGVPVVHYIAVRKEFRGHGLATKLLERIGVHRRSAAVCTSHGPSSALLRSAYPLSEHMPLEEFLK